MKKSATKKATSKKSPVKKATVKTIAVKKTTVKKAVKKVTNEKVSPKTKPLNARICDIDKSDSLKDKVNVCKVEITDEQSAKLKATSDNFGENSNEFRTELLRAIGTASLEEKEDSPVKEEANDIIEEDYSALDVLTEVIEECIESDEDAIEWIDALAETRDFLIAKLEKRQDAEQNSLNERVSLLKIRQK